MHRLSLQQRLKGLQTPPPFTTVNSLFSLKERLSRLAGCHQVASYKNLLHFTTRCSLDVIRQHMESYVKLTPTNSELYLSVVARLLALCVL